MPFGLCPIKLFPEEAERRRPWQIGPHARSADTHPRIALRASILRSAIGGTKSTSAALTIFALSGKADLAGIQRHASVLGLSP